MREGFDREVDSLLRRAARAPAAGVGAGGPRASAAGAHLDADELAAFAEGALPEAARTSAVSHLADCAECRTHAVGLTRAAGVEAELEKRAAATAAASSSSTARESRRERTGWLASLFAPRTLRYVAPVLALCLVAAVSFVALRSRRDGGLVAQRESPNAASHAPVTTGQANSQPSPESTLSSATTANANANANTSSNTAGEVARDAGAADKPAPSQKKDVAEGEAPDGSAAPSQPESKAADADLAPPPPPPAPAKEGASAGGAATAPSEITKSTAENLPTPKKGENTKAGPPPPVQTNDEVVSNEKAQQRVAQQRGYETQTPDGSRSNRSAANSVSGGLANAAPRDDRDSRARRESPPASKRGRAGQDAPTEDERGASSEESRSVAGHRFRREGGAWVDVNYKSSMASTGVRRGTDAYRALVADIPEVGRVAEQLGGEVVVVVRGRSYRIR
jgi:hypothetical protein